MWVGTVDPAKATLDASERAINDPWPTPFATGGFDLDAVGVRHVAADTGYAAWRRVLFFGRGAGGRSGGGDRRRSGPRRTVQPFGVCAGHRAARSGRRREPRARSAVADGGRLALAFALPAGRDDLAVVVEWSADLAAPATWYSDDQHVAAPLVEKR